ncbi:hypothetical protein Plec18170_004164 [Paecilomyces lecythidis]
MEKPPSKQAELKKLSEVHTRLEAWRKNVPKEMDPKEGQLPQVLLMHMFYQLLFIHLYRPFLKYTKSTSPLPQHVSPRKLCTQAAATISKLLRVYRRSYGFRQICNIAVYIAHSACTIHLLNLPEKNARRDIIHGLRNLEEIAESWLCARRTLRILDISATKWHIDLPPEAVTIFERTRSKWGSWGSWDHGSSPASSAESPMVNTSNLSSTMPSSYSTPGRLPQAVRPESHSQATASVKFSVPQSQQNFFPNAARLSAARQSRRSFSGQMQRPSVAPEPTYLGPTSQAAYPPPTAAQSPQDMWNSTQDACNVSNSSNSPAPIVNTPPMPIFNGVDSLVEESQDWWLRDQSALALGMENWGEGWETADQAAAFSMSYNPNIPVPAQTTRENIPSAPQQMANNAGFPMPTGPVVNQNPYRYMNRPNSGHR